MPHEIDKLVESGWKLHTFSMFDYYVAWMQNPNPDKNDICGIGDTFEEALSNCNKEAINARD